MPSASRLSQFFKPAAAFGGVALVLALVGWVETPVDAPAPELAERGAGVPAVSWDAVAAQLGASQVLHPSVPEPGWSSQDFPGHRALQVAAAF